MRKPTPISPAMLRKLRGAVDVVDQSSMAAPPANLEEIPLTPWAEEKIKQSRDWVTEQQNSLADFVDKQQKSIAAQQKEISGIIDSWRKKDVNYNDQQHQQRQQQADQLLQQLELISAGQRDKIHELQQHQQRIIGKQLKAAIDLIAANQGGDYATRQKAANQADQECRHCGDDLHNQRCELGGAQHRAINNFRQQQYQSCNSLDNACYRENQALANSAGYGHLLP